MLATPWERPFDDPGWSFEVKWDGVRLLAHRSGYSVVLRTRRGRDASVTYPELARPMRELAGSIVLDGEVVVLDAAGRPSFERLQQRMNITDVRRAGEAAARHPVAYVAFDLLYDGADLTTNSYAERRRRLLELELPAPIVAADAVEGEGVAMWEFVTARSLEGMVAKRLDGRYLPGVRSPDWRKIPYRKLLRAVVGGYLPGEGARSSTFGSLLVGLFDGPSLRWIGAVGSGFGDRELGLIFPALRAQVTAESPFVAADAIPSQAIWVVPQLVAVVEYKEWTSAGRLRAPVWKGFSATPIDEATWGAEGPPA
jgi:bifunctional non-homologous end joining protein LigD